MATERLEIRLDSERRGRLRHVADDEGTSVAEAVRGLLDLGYAEWMRARRLEAAQRIIAMELPDDVPDPDELSRQLAEAHDPGLP